MTPQPGQQPLLSLVVLGILVAGTVLIGIEVAVLWPGTGPDNHWPLRLLVTWAVVLLLSEVVRRFLVQYLGDVVVYEESHTVDRFADLRARIRECVTERARALYAAGGADAYDQVNIYSPWDIISGSLEYFDLPGSKDPRRVDNLRDREATTLLMAHVEYWENGLLPEVLSKALTTT